MRHYGRNKCFEPFVGDHNDPLVVIHDIYRAKGIAVGNEAVSVTKRSGGLVGVFRHGSKENSRLVTIPWVHVNKNYEIL